MSEAAIMIVTEIFIGLLQRLPQAKAEEARRRIVANLLKADLRQSAQARLDARRDKG